MFRDPQTYVTIIAVGAALLLLLRELRTLRSEWGSEVMRSLNFARDRASEEYQNVLAQLRAHGVQREQWQTQLLVALERLAERKRTGFVLVFGRVARVRRSPLPVLDLDQPSSMSPDEMRSPTERAQPPDFDTHFVAGELVKLKPDADRESISIRVHEALEPGTLVIAFGGVCLEQVFAGGNMLTPWNVTGTPIARVQVPMYPGTELRILVREFEW